MIEPYKWYTPTEFRKNTDLIEADNLVMRGFVLQNDVMSGMVRVVPWHVASGAKEPEWKDRKLTDPDKPVEITRKRMFKTTMDKPDPIVRRTPSQRVSSLAARMMLEVQKSGVLPGADDPRVKTIVGEAFKEGTPVTGEQVQTMAAHFLQQSENQKKRRDFKKVTTTPN